MLCCVPPLSENDGKQADGPVIPKLGMQHVVVRRGMSVVLSSAAWVPPAWAPPRKVLS